LLLPGLELEEEEERRVVPYGLAPLGGGAVVVSDTEASFGFAGPTFFILTKFSQTLHQMTLPF
jgi:hypothetical protein